MKFILFSILAFLSIPVLCQTSADSIRITELKNQLPTSSGTKKVDLLNDIAWEYGWAALKDKSPAFDYAFRARNLASKLTYQRGIGYALITISWLKQNEDCDSLINAAISIGEKEKDDKLLGRAYHRRWEMKKAFEYYKKAGDLQGEAEAATWLCTEYAGKGQYDNEFNYCQRAIELARLQKISTPTYSSFISSLAFETMSKLFSKVGEYSTAFQYLKEAEKFSAADVFLGFAELYKEMEKYDSSVYYFEQALQKTPGNGKLKRQVGTANFLAKNYQRAIELLENGLKGENDPNFKWQLPVNWRGSQHLELALSYQALKNSDHAKKHFVAALQYQQRDYQKVLSEKDPNKTASQKAGQLMDISYGLSKSFYALGKIDSAYTYLEKYIRYKDQVSNINTISRLNMQLSNYKKALADEKRTSQLNLLNKDNQLKQAKLKQEGLLKNGLIVGIIVLLILAFIVIRMLTLKRRNERLQFETALQTEKQRQSDLQRQSVELEMQALRAQMNPHFIFNCLSSINHFILKNESKVASKYLTRFSRLMRMVLINSKKPIINLEDELQMLRLYLEMERLRFKNQFSYRISFLNEIDVDNVFIPPLLLQPFCENAIWHGLMNKDGEGMLQLDLEIFGSSLRCTITDNGIGRKKAAELRTKTAEKDKSMGIKITSDRLSLINQEDDLHSFFNIEDLVDESGEPVGTKVMLKIRCFETPSYLHENVD